MGKGSGGSAMLELKSGAMRDHDYTTLFKLEHMLKDVRLCLEEGQAAAVPFAAAARARDVLVAALARGHARRRLRRARRGARGVCRHAPRILTPRPAPRDSPGEPEKRSERLLQGCP